MKEKSKVSKGLKIRNIPNLEDMEIDISEWIPNWVVIRLAENKTLDEELAREGPISFEDELVTLHCSSYQKDSINLLLQHRC